ncbi:MAG TPA: nitrate- and nitrite sensing domain-containing protein [Acidimicrobiales bacterium]|nr:nitrate- and nitrite sensing domain-containing protein [Acidimicrobiales bacterium]
MARRITIRAKLAAALAVPLLALVLVAGLEVADSVNEAAAVERQTDLATASIGPSGLVTALQNERNFTGLWLLGSEGIVNLPVDSIEEARSATDDARDAFAREVADKGGDVSRIYDPALRALDVLDGLRANVDGYQGTRTVTEFNQVAEDSFMGYSELISDLSDQNSVLSSEVQDDDLRRGVQLIDMSSREIDVIARMVRLGLLGEVTGDGRIASPDEIAAFADIVNQGHTNHYRILDLAAGRYGPAGEKLRVESDATGLLPMGPEILATGEVDIPRLLDAVSIGDDESYYGFLHDVSSQVQVRADELNGAARARSRWYIVAAALVVAAAVGAIVAVSRSIVRPLRQLTKQSMAMARSHLPNAVKRVLDTPVGQDVTVPRVEPVKVDSRDEVADVAATLNRVQSAAVQLAVDQALLRRNVADAFVNLARRNQNLLSRQLDFITELEREETRTETLESLFRLDHHATRMRRNAESLLVLAGERASRQWSGPVRITDVIRAALGEVEDYRRVAIHDVEPATVLGSVAADLAHLLAELIENALRFSPPDRLVEVTGQARDDHFLVLISDDGMGMSRDDLNAANRRLSRAEGLSVASSRFLGHHVAGNLAARHGISVRLHQLAYSGITAAVALPSSVFVAGAAGLGGQAGVGAGWSGPAPSRPAGTPPVPAGARPALPRRPVAAQARPPHPAPPGPPAGGPPAGAPTPDALPAAPRVLMGTPVAPTSAARPPEPATTSPPRPTQDATSVAAAPRHAAPPAAPVGVGPAPTTVDLSMSAPPPVAPAPPRKHTPDDVYRLLSIYAAGVDRGRSTVESEHSGSE